MDLITKEKAQEIIKNSEWSVKGVKFMKGHDADSMECSLYKDNKRVATVWDDSYGGGFQYTWIKNYGKEFEIFSRTLLVKTDYAPKGMTYNGDCVIDELVNGFEETKQYKRWCKTKTVFCLKGDKDGEWRIFNNKYGDRLIKHIEKEYGNKVKEILNERFV